MPLSAICPNCNVANEPTTLQCTICNTALGAMLVGDARDGFRWFTISAFVSLAIFVTCMILGLKAIVVVLPLFYGPLLASYYARANVVWSSALGGMATLVFLLFFALLVDSDANTAKQMIMRFEGGDPATLPTGGKLVLGAVLILFAALPVTLTGASVGEHLSVRRRRTPTQLGGVYFADRPARDTSPAARPGSSSS